MKAPHFLVVAFPKLDREQELQRLREKHNARLDANRPYIVVVRPFIPATLDEIQSISDFISQTRRRLLPLALSFRECIEQGSYLCLTVEQGREELLELHRIIMGSEPLSLVKERPDYEPVLIIGRFPDPDQRAQAAADTRKLGRVLGLVDALTITRVDHDSAWHLVARFPFGIGRVDFYEKLLA